MIVSLSGIYGDWEAHIRRGYLNAGLPDGSQGTTDVDTLSGRLRVDWVDAFALHGWSFTPRAAFSVTEIDMDGYTEFGGGFPARFNGMSHTATEIRLGLTGETAMTERTTFRAIIEGVHRLDDDNAGFSGQVPGLFGFNLQGAKNDQTWARVGAEITHLVNDRMAITGTVFGATQGEDPVLTTSLNFSIGF